MKTWIATCLALILLGLTGCTATIYGVPQERWESMGEQERVAAMEAYRARQAVLLQQRQERARQLALERERQQAIEAEEARQRQLRVDAIYRGEGVYGDLLRVRVEEGRLKLRGSHRAYQPVAFRIAVGETKQVEVVDLKGKKAALLASYDGSTLLLDEKPGDGRARGVRLPYEEAWEEGTTYTGLTAKGSMELRDVSVTVQVLGEPPRDRRAGRRPQVIIIQQPAPEPENPRIVIIKEGEQRPQRPETVIVKEAPRHDRPEIVPPKPSRHDSPKVAEPPARRDKPETVAKMPPSPVKPAKIGNEPPRHEKPETVGTKQPPPKEPADTPPARVKVTFHSGNILVKGRPAPITPQSIELRNGEARTLVLQGAIGKVPVRVSYQGGEVAIDDRPGKGKTQTRLGFGPQWRKGSPYRIEATGNRLIEGLDVSVLAL